MAKYLDIQGVEKLWEKVKGITNALESGKLNASEKGVANGVATLDKNGLVTSSQLPSYVDDVIEGYLYNGEFYKENTHATLITASPSKIYVDLATNKTYRWSGSAYVEISSSLALGETSSTAYAGDKGKQLRTDFDTHAANKENPHGVTAAQLGLGSVNNTSDMDKPISNATQKVFNEISTEINKKLNKTDAINSTTNYDFVVENDGLKVLLFTPGKSGTQRVTGTTSEYGASTQDGLTIYSATGSVDIGPGYTNVTISGGIGTSNYVTYDISSGVAQYRLYALRPKVEVSAIISYSISQGVRSFLKLQNNGTIITNNGVVADNVISTSELDTILK